MTWRDALVCLHVAVTRRTMKGAVIGPEQRVGIDEALKAVTIDAAHQLQMEDRIGSIAPGKYADFVILSQDPTACDPERLLEIKLLGTVIDADDDRRVLGAPQRAHFRFDLGIANQRRERGRVDAHRKHARAQLASVEADVVDVCRETEDPQQCREEVPHVRRRMEADEIRAEQALEDPLALR